MRFQMAFFWVNLNSKRCDLGDTFAQNFKILLPNPWIATFCKLADMGDICKIIVTHIFIQVPGLTSIEAFRIELAAVNDTKTEVENSKNSRNSGVR